MCVLSSPARLTRCAEIVWVDEVVGLARPERNPVKRLPYRLRLRTRLGELRERQQPAP